MGLFESGIRPVIDNYLLEKSKERRDYGSYWSASSAFYCQRKLIFERLGVPPVTEDPRKQRVFEAGHIFHAWAQGITKDTGLSIAQEIELQDEDLMIRGHIDDLVLVGADDIPDRVDPISGEATAAQSTQHLILYDYKTAHSKWFEYAKDRPMSHYHRGQLGTYMYMLRKGEKIKINPYSGSISEYVDAQTLAEARILSISKDDLRLHEKQLLWSAELEKEVVDYWTTLNRHWQDKTMPPCTCAKHEVNKRTGVGFMADPRFNPFYFQGEPCSMAWFKQWQAEQKQLTLEEA